MNVSISQSNEEQILLQEIVNLIEQSQSKVKVQINSAVTLLFWKVGNRINQEILQNKRVDYGKRIVSTL